jgi:hypothetical protein
MLVHNIQLMEQPERLIESSVWLYRLDDVSRTLRDMLYFSLANRRCILLGSISNREVGVSPGLLPSRFNELPCEMIKSASEIMDSVSDEQRDSIGNGFDLGDIERSVLNLRYAVRLGSKSIGLFLKESLDGEIKITDVLFGPFNFQSDSVDAKLCVHAL